VYLHQVTLAMQDFLWSLWLQHVMQTTLRMLNRALRVHRDHSVASHVN
jgi:hypothetical protein